MSSSVMIDLSRLGWIKIDGQASWFCYICQRNRFRLLHKTACLIHCWLCISNAIPHDRDQQTTRPGMALSAVSQSPGSLGRKGTCTASHLVDCSSNYFSSALRSSHRDSSLFMGAIEASTCSLTVARSKLHDGPCRMGDACRMGE